MITMFWLAGSGALRGSLDLASKVIHKNSADKVAWPALM